MRTINGSAEPLRPPTRPRLWLGIGCAWVSCLGLVVVQSTACGDNHVVVGVPKNTRRFPRRLFGVRGRHNFGCFVLY